MKEVIFFRGTTLEFFNPVAYNPGLEKFILAQCNEVGFVFQIVCISGYNAGTVSGYIKEDLTMVNENKKAITYSHLVTELKRNFGTFDLETLKILS